MLQFISPQEYERILKFDNDMLQIWANRISQHYWGVPLICKISFNGRLKRTFGHFKVTKHLEKGKVIKKEIIIEISKDLVTYNDLHRSVVEKILKHELCHWYIYAHIDPKKNGDGHPYFENEIRRIDSISQSDINNKLILIHNPRPKKKVSPKPKKPLPPPIPKYPKRKPS